MLVRKLNVVVIFSLLFMACSPSLKVTSDFDKRVDFTKYKTFAFYDNSKSNISSLNHDRIVNAVRAEMQRKGFTENTQTPDLLVNISAIVSTGTDVSSNTNYYGYGGAARPYGWGVGMSSSYTSYDVQHYKEGSLIIDILDAAEKKLIWQGAGNSRIDESTKDADERIATAVKKIMEDFPPGANKK